MTPGIYYFYEYQADKKIRNVGFLKLTQTFQSCHLQISIRQIPAASQEKLPLSMFFFEKDKPRKKTVAELPTQNQCVSCRVTLSEADFPPNLTLAKLHGFLLQTADGRYFAASTGNRPFSVNLLTDWMEPAPCQEPDSESESIPAPEPETPSVLAEEKCASRQKKPHNLANRLPAYANSVMKISPPCKNHSGGLPTTAFCCMDTTTTIIFFYWKKTDISGLVFPVFILPVKHMLPSYSDFLSLRENTIKNWRSPRRMQHG